MFQKVKILFNEIIVSMNKKENSLIQNKQSPQVDHFEESFAGNNSFSLNYKRLNDRDNSKFKKKGSLKSTKSSKPKRNVRFDNSSLEQNSKKEERKSN
jgi:hypothetical protein